MIKNQYDKILSTIETLLPCPFCSSDVRVKENPPNKWNDGTFEVYCPSHGDDCFYSGGYFKKREFENVGKLIANWNRRK